MFLDSYLCSLSIPVVDINSHLRWERAETTDTTKIFSIFLIDQTIEEKSRIRETPTLSTDADSRTNTNLKRLVDFFQEVV